MASIPHNQLTDSQKRLRKHLDIASEVAIAYAAPTVPPLNNATPEGMLEELGRVHAAEAALKKTKEILKERLKALSGGAKKLESDNFTYVIKLQDRTALDQTATKEYLEKQGVLDDYLKTSEVATTYIKER